MPDTLRERLTAALADLGGDLLEVGIKSSPDPSKVAIPGAWLHPRTMTAGTLGGGMTVRVDIWLVIPDPDQPWNELLTLTDQLEKALSVPYLVPVEDIDLDIQLTLPDNPNLPAVTLAVDLDI